MTNSNDLLNNYVVSEENSEEPTYTTLATSYRTTVNIKNRHGKQRKSVELVACVDNSHGFCSGYKLGSWPFMLRQNKFAASINNRVQVVEVSVGFDHETSKYYLGVQFDGYKYFEIESIDDVNYGKGISPWTLAPHLVVLLGEENLLHHK